MFKANSIVAYVTPVLALLAPFTPVFAGEPKEKADIHYDVYHFMGVDNAFPGWADDVSPVDYVAPPTVDDVDLRPEQFFNGSRIDRQPLLAREVNFDARSRWMPSLGVNKLDISAGYIPVALEQRDSALATDETATTIHTPSLNYSLLRTQKVDLKMGMTLRHLTNDDPSGTRFRLDGPYMGVKYRF